MKKLMFSLLVTMIMVSCTGCDPINPPEPPVVKKYTISTICGEDGSISPSTLTVESGKSATFTIIPSDGYTVNVLKDNGIVVSLSSLTSYTLSNVTSDHSIEVTFKVKVGSPLSYLINGPWYECYMLSQQPDGSWGEWSKFTAVIKQTFYLSVPLWPGKRYEEYWNDEPSGSGGWDLNTSTNPALLRVSSAVYKIEKLNSDSLIYIWAGQTTNIKIFYSHVKN